MNDTAIQLKVLQLARARGLDPATMDLQTWKALQIEARGVREILRDGAKAVTTRASVIMSLNVVSDEKYAQNEAICQTNQCGFYNVKNGEPVCMKCGCSEKWLKSKMKSKRQKCPVGLWDNTNA